MTDERKPRSTVPDNAAKKQDPTAAENLAKNSELDEKPEQANNSDDKESPALPADTGSKDEDRSEAQREPRKPADEEKSDPRESSGTREEKMAMEEKRTTRIPMGRQQRLDAIAAPYQKKLQDFYLRFALDKPGRLEQYLAAGYEFVNDSNGKHVTFPSGSFHLHLMKLPLEFRKEDLEAREADISSRIVQEVKLAQDEYSPENAESALTASGTFNPDE